MNNDFQVDLDMDDILKLATLKTLDELDSSEMNLALDGSLYGNDIVAMAEHNSVEIANQFAVQLQENFMFFVQKDFQKQQNATQYFRDQL